MRSSRIEWKLTPDRMYPKEISKNGMEGKGKSAGNRDNLIRSIFAGP